MYSNNILIHVILIFLGVVVVCFALWSIRKDFTYYIKKHYKCEVCNQPAIDILTAQTEFGFCHRLYLCLKHIKIAYKLTKNSRPLLINKLKEEPNGQTSTSNK